MAARSVATHSRPRTWLAFALLVSALLAILILSELGGGEFACTPQGVVPESDLGSVVLDPVPEARPPVLVPVVASAPKSPSTPTPPSDRAVFRGRVLDVALKCPVPAVDVVVSRGKTVERVTTSCDGRFVTTTPFEPGEVALAVIDGQRTITLAPLAHDARSIEHDVLAAVRTTVWIDSIDGGAPVPEDGWVARIVDGAPPLGVAGTLRVMRGDVALRDTRALRVGEWTGLSACEGRWFVRTEASTKADSSKSSTRRVQVRSDKLRRKGQAVVDTFDATSVARSIETHAFTLVRGRLAVVGVPRPVHALVFRPDPVPDEVAEVLEFDVDVPQSGETEYRFELDGLGQYELVLWRAGATVERRAFQADGSDIELDLATSVEMPLPHANVSVGRLGFGAHAGVDLETHALRLALSGFPRTVPRWVIPVEHGTAYVALLPRASFEVEDVGVGSLPRFLGPLRNVGFDVEDVAASPSSSLVLRRASVEPSAVGGVPAERVYVSSGPCAPFVWRTSPGDPTTWPTWAGLASEVTVWAPGMRPRHVTSDEFLPIGDRDVASVRLEPGWGVELHVRTLGVGDDERSAPSRWRISDDWDRADDLLTVLSRGCLSGVRARVGDTVVAVSDANGRLLVEAARAPREIELVAKGWRVAGVTKLNAPDVGTIVWMEREP